MIAGFSYGTGFWEAVPTPPELMKFPLRRVILFAAACLSLATLLRADPAESAATPPPTSQPIAQPALPANPLIDGTPVIVWGRTLTYYRQSMEFPDVRQRAHAAADRITQSLGAIDTQNLRLHPMQYGDTRGIAVFSGRTFLLKLMEDDLPPEAGDTLTADGEKILADLRLLAADHTAQHTISLLIPSILQAVIATVLFVAFWIFVAWMKARLLRRIAWSTKESGQFLNFFGYDWRPVLLGFAVTLTRLLMLTVILCGAYAWMTFVLSRFPYTRHWGEQLGSYLFAAVSSLGSGALHQIPNIIALIVIYLVTRGVIRVLNGWFSAIESGKQMTGWLDPEAARATRRLADIGVWIIAVIVAFPYLPGSHSEAFKGISVFLGLMLSLGGAGFVSQVIGGLAAVYSRAVRSGDYIVVGETQGVVKELGLFTTKVITRTREEVTIPNSLLISSAIRNFSRSANNTTVISTTVTIGYDAPWRQVQALLLEAAAQTESLLKDPAPHVRQTSLDDFYVRYELVGCVDHSSIRTEVLDRLHGKIQDLFNEHGVQIMSPNFESQPSQAVLVPKERWHAAPATPQT
jgi:small-conductance mechanosensitive channel